ncbi:MAG TPA: site-specific integrase [Enterococcus sp.]|nr:site-specific integrase [Enterococcus sp.]
MDESVKKDLLYIESKQVNAYVDHLKEKKLSDTTIKRHISALSQFLAFYDIGAGLLFKQTEAKCTSSLETSDFISDQEMHRLLESMQRPIDSVARDFLIDRNLDIVHLIRYKGLRPKEIRSINIGMVNLEQATFEFKQSLLSYPGK